jgi:hypothetical protein
LRLSSRVYYSVISAKAGILTTRHQNKIAAFAGMTGDDGEAEDDGGKSREVIEADADVAGVRR